MEVLKPDELLTSIYEDTYNDVLRYVVIKCRNVDDIQDLMQNVYLNLYKRLRKHGQVKEPKKYLIKIAKHELFKHYGLLSFSKNFIPVFSQADDEDFSRLESQLCKEEINDDALLVKELWQYIKSRDILTFKIFTLYFSKGFKICEIAEQLKVNESMVKNRLYRTIKEINKKFEL
ncbi:RNA polymerase sigma factor [Clostridium drakei]|uniref:RNA polymerase subunit sigma n=1 Tax=Clostridium drakei TaxID=332101 RepID=A0A2U8DW25_9CLOT|nr:sigma-70 family RNA polymerase sigma factor [Clostridium drakei]AWI06252.1 RNA polymerase subunit sigma [Clostridium drakei]